MTEMIWTIAQLKAFLLSSCDTCEKPMPHVKNALEFAELHHQGQYRRSRRSAVRTAYIYHPLVVACQAVSLGFLDDDILCTCLLHDVCEDCGVLPQELPCSKDAQVAVTLLTKSPDFDGSERMEQDYYRSISQNRIATIVKLLDRIHNLSCMVYGFADCKIRSYLEEAETYFLPMLCHAEKTYPDLKAPLFQIRYQLQTLTEIIGDLL